MTILCIACYFKGKDFITTAKKLGCKVIVLTSKSVENADWPKESIDEILYVDADDNDWDMADILKGINHISRKTKIDKIVALDDFDVERAAHIREHLRMPGMGETRARYFRDKLAMRTMAKEAEITVPDFTGLFADEDVKAFIKRTPLPWILKARSQASATGMKKITSEKQLWEEIDLLGDQQGFYLLEEFLPGNVYHVDGLCYDDKVLFSLSHQYMNTPMEVAHEGGVFRTHTVLRDSADDKELRKMNKKIMKGFGLKYGATHTEFIKADRDGKFYFLETSSRVGGANIAELVEAGSSINLWAEWAKIEILPKGKYKLPKLESNYAGIIISLAKQKAPNTSAYNDSEIVWKMHKEYHAGMIVKSDNYEKILELLSDYGKRFRSDFTAIMPLPDKPTA